MQRYQRAFIDFFEDQLVQVGYDWKALLDEYLYKGKEPLINNMICGGRKSSLSHPQSRPPSLTEHIRSLSSTHPLGLRPRTLVPHRHHRSSSNGILQLQLAAQIPRRPILHPLCTILLLHRYTRFTPRAPSENPQRLPLR